MTLAILRLPDLAMIAQLMHMDHQDRVVLRAACDIAGGALRLAPPSASDALAVTWTHDIHAWIGNTPLTAAARVRPRARRSAGRDRQVWLATLALTQAAAAVPEDRMLVPDRPREEPEASARRVCDCRAAGRCDSNPIPGRRRTMNSNPTALIACESVLDPILEHLTTCSTSTLRTSRVPSPRHWSGCGQPPPIPA